MSCNRFASLGLALLLSACSTGSTEMASALPPPPTPPTAPPPLPLSTEPDNWMDGALTPGGWRYSSSAERTVASFGPGADQPLLSLTCNWRARSITLTRSGAAPQNVVMRILAESRSRLADAVPVTSPYPAVITTIAAGDPIFDAMAFSKGRFALETAGMATLYLPAWAEVTRVMEDCR